VAPLGDIRNEAFGGPMMLRVPAESLTVFATYAGGMKARGYDYWTIGTKMSFDPTEAYPKLVFEPIRSLVDDEARAVLELGESQAVQSILAEGSEEVVVEATIKLPPAFPEKVEAPITPPVTPKVTPP